MRNLIIILALLLVLAIAFQDNESVRKFALIAQSVIIILLILCIVCKLVLSCNCGCHSQYKGGRHCVDCHKNHEDDDYDVEVIEYKYE